MVPMTNTESTTATADPRLAKVPADAVRFTFDRPEPVKIGEVEYRGRTIEVFRDDYPRRLSTYVGSTAEGNYQSFTVWHATEDHPVAFGTIIDKAHRFFGHAKATEAKAVARAKAEIDLVEADDEIRPVAIRALGMDVADWDVEATVDQVQVGQIVGVYSRGKVRPVVVEKIGKKNIGVAYVTPSGVTERPRTALVTRKSVSTVLTGRS